MCMYDRVIIVRLDTGVTYEAMNAYLSDDGRVIHSNRWRVIDGACPFVSKRRHPFNKGLGGWILNDVAVVEVGTR